MQAKRKANPKQAKGKATANPPKWWGETDATDPDADKWRVDCPIKYKMALYYLFEEMGRANWEGKPCESLKDPAFMEALEIVANPQNAGTDAESLAEMAAELAQDKARYQKEDDILLRDLDRANFLKALFSDKPFVGEIEARERRYFLRRPNMVETWRRLLKDEKLDVAAIADFLKWQAVDDDDLKDTSNNPALIRAAWLNSEFAVFADSYLSPWLDYVELPQTFATEKLRAEIAYNYGLFPLPFDYGIDDEGNGMVTVSETLTSLLRLLKIAAARYKGEPRKTATKRKSGGMGKQEFANRCGVEVRQVSNWNKDPPDCYIPRMYDKGTPTMQRATELFIERYRATHNKAQRRKSVRATGEVRAYFRAEKERYAEHLEKHGADIHGED